MELRLASVGKRYNNDLIFSGLNCEINPLSPTVILGSNGSGKSTLLQVIAGFAYPSEGSIGYFKEGKEIEADDVYRHLAFASPYQELIEEFSLSEILEFQNRLKPFIANYSVAHCTELLELSNTGDKPIKYFSSGMKQRLKLLLALCSSAPLLLLDEPTSNLDKAGIDWYKKMLENHLYSRTLIIASNHLEQEYFLCSQQINLSLYKGKKPA